MSTLTITLEAVPDELLAMTATPEGMARARAAVLNAFGLGSEGSDLHDDYKLTLEDIEALKQGAADIDAGRVTDGRVHIAEMRQMLLDRKQARKEAA
jgi:hypothetical protein